MFNTSCYIGEEFSSFLNQCDYLIYTLEIIVEKQEHPCTCTRIPNALIFDTRRGKRLQQLRIKSGLQTMFRVSETQNLTIEQFIWNCGNNSIFCPHRGILCFGDSIQFFHICWYYLDGRFLFFYIFIKLKTLFLQDVSIF